MTSYGLSHRLLLLLSDSEALLPAPASKRSAR